MSTNIEYRHLLGPCDGCVKGKMTQEVAVTSKSRKADKIGELIHMDFMFFNGDTHLITSDDYSNYIISIYLKTRDKQSVVNAIKRVLNINTSYGITVKELRSDSESVFIESEDSINSFGALLSTVAPSHHEKSIERLIRTVKEKTRSIIYGLPYKLPLSLYRYAPEYAISHNAVPNIKTEHESPSNMLYGRKYAYR